MYKASVIEAAVHFVNKAYISLDIDGSHVRIPLPAEVKARYDEQFVRQNPTHQQKGRLLTLMHLVRAAYRLGRQHGQQQGVPT